MSLLEAPRPTRDAGYTRAVDSWTRLRQFLILGSEDGRYVAGERELAGAQCEALMRCIGADGVRAVAEIVHISNEGVAPRDDALMLALDMCVGAGDARTRQAALEALPLVCQAYPDPFGSVEEMPLAALIRNVATMTRVGVVVPGSAATETVVERLADPGQIRRARLHPLAVLMALRAYRCGQGPRDTDRWKPVPAVLDAFDAAFYASFENVEPTGARLLVALDVSESMASSTIAGAPGLSPRDASIAMALVTATTEPAHELVGFGEGRSWSEGIQPLPIGANERLECATATISLLRSGRTDPALPMLSAMERRREVDTFVIYTDSSPRIGSIHPVQALCMYRAKSGIHARLIVVGMSSASFAIADPSDSGMLDVVGFDAGTPALIAAFASRSL